MGWVVLLGGSGKIIYPYRTPFLLVYFYFVRVFYLAATALLINISTEAQINRYFTRKGQPQGIAPTGDL